MAKHAVSLFSVDVIKPDLSGRPAADHLRTTRAIYNERRLAFLEAAKILGGALDFQPVLRSIADIARGGR
jgi:hypothetical protein